jgi:hypothetical protein
LSSSDVTNTVGEGNHIKNAEGFLLIPYLLIFLLSEIWKKCGQIRHGIPSIHLFIQLIFMIFFGIERISHCNYERDLGKCLVAGLTKMPDQSLLQRFLDTWDRSIVETLLTSVSKRAHTLGQIIGRILNIDTHTKPFYGKSEMKKTKVSRRNRVMKAVITAFVQDQETGNMIYATNEFGKYTLSQMLRKLVEKVKCITGTLPEHILFDLGFYNGRVFAWLKMQNIKFTTLCKKYPNAKIKIQKVVAENKFIPIKFTTPTRKRMKGKIIDTTTTHVRHYRWKLRLIILKVQGKKELISFLTSDFESSNVEVIERYARRWRIENWFTEQLCSTFLDNIPSSDYLKNDILDDIRIITSHVMKLFMNDVGPDYVKMFPRTFYREILKDLSGYVTIKEDIILVTFDYFDNQYLFIPLFKDINQKLESMGVDPHIPWLGNRKLDIRFTKNVS